MWRCYVTKATKLGRTTLLVPADYQPLHVVGSKRWRQVWKQRLVLATLVCSDVSLALLIWWGASALQGIWGTWRCRRWQLAPLVPVTAAWVGLRALLGLYPGYGLDSVEELLRHSYSVFATS